MRRTAVVTSLLVLAALPWQAQGQVRWTDKEGKVHVTGEMPKEDQVSADEWKRLQADADKATAAAKADEGEKLPDLSPGVVLRWKDKGGTEHHTNVPPKRSEVSEGEWNRLKEEIPKVNAAASSAPTAVPAKPEPTAAPATEGEKLPDLAPGKTVQWTGKDGKKHMTSTPPGKSEVDGKEWERLKGAIAEINEEAKKEPPAPAATAAPDATPSSSDSPGSGAGGEDDKKEPKTEEKPPASTGASLGSGDGVLTVDCQSVSVELPQLKVAGSVTNTSPDQVARNIRVAIDVLADGKTVRIDDFEPVKLSAIYPGHTAKFDISFELPKAIKTLAISCEAHVLEAQLAKS